MNPTGPQIDERDTSLIIARFPATLGRPDADILIQLMQRILIRDTPYVLVSDLRNIRSFPFDQFKRVSDFAKDNYQDFQRICLGDAYVVSSITGRMLVRSFTLVSRTPGDVLVTADRDEALTWGRQLLEKS